MEQIDNDLLAYLVGTYPRSPRLAPGIVGIVTEMDEYE